MNQKRRVITIVAVAIAAGLCCLLWFPMRPLFHRWGGFAHGPHVWQPIEPLLDGEGNYGYLDADLNMLVIVSTKDPEFPEHVLPPTRWAREARLLAGSPYEVRVGASENTLLLFFGRESLAIAIAPGEAELWYNQILTASGKGYMNLMEEISKRCPAESKDKLETYVRKNSLQGR